jgi:hypothetical protein
MKMLTERMMEDRKIPAKVAPKSQLFVNAKECT